MSLAKYGLWPPRNPPPRAALPGVAWKNGISATSCADVVPAARKIDAQIKTGANDWVAFFIASGIVAPLVS